MYRRSTPTPAPRILKDLKITIITVKCCKLCVRWAKSLSNVRDYSTEVVVLYPVGQSIVSNAAIVRSHDDRMLLRTLSK